MDAFPYTFQALYGIYDAKEDASITMIDRSGSEFKSILFVKAVP